MNQILIGDCKELLKTIPDQTAHCCVTSTPYYGLRDYGIDGQIGLEQSPEAYVAELVEVFREVWRVLRDDGTVWLNLGDCYARAGGSAYINHIQTLFPDNKEAADRLIKDGIKVFIQMIKEKAKTIS